MILGARQVAIVGAGIGGLTSALAFNEAGFAVDIFERAAKLDETGAGLQLSPNALRVLKRLSVTAWLEFSGVKASVVTLRAARSGRVIAHVPMTSQDGVPYMSVRRADLQSALLAEVRLRSSIILHLDHELTGIAGHARGARLYFETPRGKVRVESDATVAADGVRSRIGSVLGHPAAIPSGDVAWRMTMRQPEEAIGSGIEAWLGPGRHAVSYPISAGAALNLVLIGPESEATYDFGSGPDAVREKLLRLFRGWDPRLLDIISQCGPIQAWPLLDARRRPRAGDPPGMLFIGDAGHAMRPYAAQGAAMAIEDGYVAASAFARTRNGSEAVDLFEKERTPRIERVQRRVDFHDFVYHMASPLSFARDAFLAVRSPAALRRDLSWLYDWQLPTL